MTGGSVVDLSQWRSRRAAVTAARAGPDLSPAAAHIRKALERYRRDLRLVMGRERPHPGNVDDIAILVRFRATGGRRFIGDRVLRIKTLEAMLDLVLEGPQAIALPAPSRRRMHV